MADLVRQQQDEKAHDKPPLALHDFAAHAYPGAPGVRWHTNPATGETLVGVPVGMNWNKAKDYRMPAVQSRREWERNRISAPHQTDTVRIPITTCARCTILIGKGYFQYEAYLEPVLPPQAVYQTRPLWRIVCGIHALEHGLHPGFALIVPGDYIAVPDQQLRRQFKHVRLQKAQQLEHAFVPAWRAYARERLIAFKTLGQRWNADPSQRRVLFEEIFKPEWATYLALYYRLTANEWWKQFDMYGYACSEHHSRPEECAMHFHHQLVPLRLVVLFECFKTIYQPQVATMVDLIQEEESHAA